MEHQSKIKSTSSSFKVNISWLRFNLSSAVANDHYHDDHHLLADFVFASTATEREQERVPNCTKQVDFNGIKAN